MRIVDHQDITADAQKCAADTGRKPRAALGIIDLDFRILIVAEGVTRSPKPLIKRRLDQSARQVGVAQRQGVGVAAGQEPHLRVRFGRSAHVAPMSRQSSRPT